MPLFKSLPIQPCLDKALVRGKRTDKPIGDQVRAQCFHVDFGFQIGFLDFMWISGFHVDFQISKWISTFWILFEELLFVILKILLINRAPNGKIEGAPISNLFCWN